MTDNYNRYNNNTPPACSCGNARTERRISNSEKNPNRAYFSCRFCNAFCWEDRYKPGETLRKPEPNKTELFFNDVLIPILARIESKIDALSGR